jgi:hypothetical protein
MLLRRELWEQNTGMDRELGNIVVLHPVSPQGSRSDERD